MSPIVIIGLDIASYKTGYAVFDLENIRFKLGLMEMNGSMEDRVRSLHYQAKSLFNTYNPAMAIVESTYLDEHRKHKVGFSKKRGNLDTLKILEKCHGAVISASDDFIDFVYMKPSEHKELIAGMGNASKKASIWAIQKKLGVGVIGDDEADAASLVLAHLMKKEQWATIAKFSKG